MPHNHGSARRQAKRDGAAQRAEAYNKLTPKEKMQQLDQLFGEGVGAKKQRAKLAEQLQKEPVQSANKKK